MMARLHIPAHETGLIRVFAVNRPIPDMARSLRRSDISTVASELLNHPVADPGVELFPLSDLAELGLGGYLAEAYDIDPAALTQDRGKLTGLDGYVLLLFSEALRAEEVTLTPGSDLTLIATYSEPRAKMTGAAPESAAAQPYTGPQNAASGAPAPRKAGSAVIMLGLVLLALALWLILR